MLDILIPNSNFITHYFSYEGTKFNLEKKMVFNLGEQKFILFIYFLKV